MLKKINVSEEFPEPFRKALGFIRKRECVDYHTGQPARYDFSITELLKPLQAIYLARKFDYEVDGLKNTAALMGTAFHHEMESQEIDNPDDYILEARFFKNIDDKVVSGQFDMYHKPTQILWDYKTAGMYKVGKALNSDNRAVDARDWFIQTNVYRYLSGLKCRKIKILAIPKDFKYNNYYKIKQPAVVIDIPLANLDSIERWLFKKVRKVSNMLETEQYPNCSEKDTWSGVFCKDWCDVNSVCDQYQDTKL